MQCRETLKCLQNCSKKRFPQIFHCIKCVLVIDGGLLAGTFAVNALSSLHDRIKRCAGCCVAGSVQPRLIP